MTAAAHTVPEVERIDVGVAWSARPTEAWYERASRTVRVGTDEVRRRSRVRREGGGVLSASYDYTLEVSYDYTLEVNDEIVGPGSFEGFSDRNTGRFR